MFNSHTHFIYGVFHQCDLCRMSRGPAPGRSGCECGADGWGSKTRLGCDSALASRAVPWVLYSAALLRAAAWVSRWAFLHPALYGHAEDRLASQFEVHYGEYGAVSYCTLPLASCLFFFLLLLFSEEDTPEKKPALRCLVFTKYGISLQNPWLRWSKNVSMPFLSEVTSTAGAIFHSFRPWIALRG